MKTSFIPIDYAYFDFEGRNYAKIIGRDENGKRICLIDSCQIYFWAILKNNIKQKEINELIKKIEKIQLDVKGRMTKVEKVELHEKNYLGKKVKALKIFATNYKDLHDIADKLGDEKIEKRRGYDLGFITHYILEKKIKPLCWYEIDGEILNNSLEFGGIDSILEVDQCIKVKKIISMKESGESNNKINLNVKNNLSKSKQGTREQNSADRQGGFPNFKPKVLAYDIECDSFKIGEGEILMVSLVSENFKKILTWKRKTEQEVKSPEIEYAKNEADLLEKFAEYVKKISPDFLVGYFSDGFDLPYLKARAEKNEVKLSLGLDGSQPKFLRGMSMTGKIDGIVHIDILKFIRSAYSQYMQSETLSLNEVAKEFLGDSKKEFKFKHSSEIKEDEWKEYYEYNLHDSVLTYGLFEKFWPDLLEFTKIMQEPIFDVSRNSMSRNVEDYIIHNLEKFNEIVEKRPGYNEVSERKNTKKYEGAFVFEPAPGIYENLAVFDFTSSYGSTIVTYNLSKSTLLEKQEKNSYSIETAGQKIYFSKNPGFIPEMLKEIIEKRKKFKQELKINPEDSLKKARSNAFKLLANAYYGYQGFFGARYYCREAAAATAAFAKKLIQEVIEKINEEKYKTIYSDTDSIAFLLGKKTKDQTNDFLKKLNSELPGIMELELEGFFKRGIWVSKRSGNIGAKKKYALIDENKKIKIRGFETVRRDWCALARKLQNKIIRQILEDGDEKKAMETLKEAIKKIKERDVKKEELIIRTQLKKSLSEYKAISPHVIAAKKMQEKEIPISEGNLIEYYIAETSGNKKLVREKVKLPEEPGKYDIDYYLERQILPAVENIFQVFDIDIKEILDGKKQTTLRDF